MTRKEAKRNIIYAIRWNDMPNKEALEMAIKALEQEPCEDEYIKVPKKALKYRTAGMVAYNAEWLKNHFDIERAVICGEQELCEDAINRQAAVRWVKTECNPYGKPTLDFESGKKIIKHLKQMPPVTLEPKTGHWIKIKPYPLQMHDYECSECGHETDDNTEDYCSDCGAKMG